MKKLVEPYRVFFVQENTQEASKPQLFEHGEWMKRTFPPGL